MEIEILAQEEDPVIDREYVRFKIEHLSEPTPSRENIREALLDEISADPELLTIIKIQSRYGRPISDGEAFLYGNKETKEKFARPYLVKRTRVKARETTEGPEEEEAKEKEPEKPGEEEKEPEVEEEKEEKEAKEEEEKKKEEPEEKEPEEEEKEEPEKEEKEGFECPECGRIFDTKRGMKIHKGKVH